MSTGPLHAVIIYLLVLILSFKDAQHHNSLLDFLKSVARCYLEQKRPKEFIMDLLELNVPDLFMMDCEGSTSTIQSDILSNSVPDEFTQFLTEYIQRNHLHQVILEDVEKIWVSNCDNRLLFRRRYV